jgi:transposase
MYRYELTDVQGEQIAAFFPDRYHQGGAGHPWKEHRPMVNGILWHLHTGAPCGRTHWSQLTDCPTLIVRFVESPDGACADV